MASDIWNAPVYIPDFSSAGYPDWLSDRETAARHLDSISEKNSSSNGQTRFSSPQIDERGIDSELSDVNEILSTSRMRNTVRNGLSTSARVITSWKDRNWSRAFLEETNTALRAAKRIKMSEYMGELGFDRQLSQLTSTNSTKDLSTDDSNSKVSAISCDDNCDPDVIYVSTKPIDPSKRRRKLENSNQSYACDHCGKMFTRRALRDNHMRTHTDERPFGCTVHSCNQTFKQKNERIRHEQSKHQSKRFVCGGIRQSGTPWGCGKKFARSDGLLEHYTKTSKGRRCQLSRDEDQ